MSDAPEIAGAAVRFVVVRHMPMLVMGLGDTPADELLFTRLSMAGLGPIPRFFGVNLPRGARVGFTLTFERMRLEDESGEGMLQVPRPAIDLDWLAEATRLKGTMLLVGRELDLDPDADDEAVCNELEARAIESTASGNMGRQIRAAIVGVVEPREGLPLFF